MSLPHLRAAIAAAACLAAAPAAAEPLQLLANGLPVTELRIDGRGPHRFVIDTAATRTSILPGYFAALGKSPTIVGGQTIQGVGGAASIDLVALGDLAVAGRTIPAVEAYALPPSPVDQLGVEGVLGADVLSTHVLVLDAPRRDWRLETKLADADVTNAGAPFTLDDGQTPRLTVMIDGQAVPAIIDTGAARTVMNWAAARALGVDQADPALQHGGSASGVGAAATSVVRHTFKNLEVAGQSRRAPELRIADLPVFGALGFPEGPAIIIGMDQFADRRLVIDYPNRRLYLGAIAG